MSIVKAQAHAVVLAGGSGMRLWPLSRALFPKQLLSFENEYSLLQLTLKRALGLFEAECIHIVTGAEHAFEVRRQAAMLDPRLESGVIVEPLGRNTLPAILLGLHAAWTSDDAPPLLAVFPSDHHIPERASFDSGIRQALQQAADGWLVTFGISPHSPETGYGYIERAELLESSGKGPAVFRVARFVEKPDRARAEQFLRSGNYFWNSGIFVFPAQELLAEVGRLQPELAAWWQTRHDCSLTERYATLPSISVDYGIMESATHTAVIEAEFDWDDLGSWEALYRLASKDADGCATQGDVLALDCRNSLLMSNSGKLVAVGVDNLVAVQTQDATLICSRDAVERVRDVVEHLKQAQSPLAEVHQTVLRPWGSYTVLEEGEGYKLKRIMVRPGGVLSLQYHHHRAEHWVVVRGKATVQLDDREVELSEREWISIPEKARHRLANKGDDIVELIEVQSGPYLEEDDIVRLEDIYGRGSAS